MDEINLRWIVNFDGRRGEDPRANLVSRDLGLHLRDHFPHPTEEALNMGRWALSELGLPDEVPCRSCAGTALRVVDGLEA